MTMLFHHRRAGNLPIELEDQIVVSQANEVARFVKVSTTGLRCVAAKVGRNSFPLPRGGALVLIKLVVENLALIEQLDLDLEPD